MTFEARAMMHTLRVWDAIMQRPEDSLPRLAWAELVRACEEAGNPEYTWVWRVKQVLERIGHPDWLSTGIPAPDGAAEQEKMTPKGLIHIWESEQWHQRCWSKSSCETYNNVREVMLFYPMYLEHPDDEVNLVRWRLRTGICACRQHTGVFTGVDKDRRFCEVEGCTQGNGIETPLHFICECAAWQAQRTEMEQAVMRSPKISEQLKRALGPRMEDNPELWFRAVMCGPLHDEMGAEYAEPIATLKKRISSRRWMDVDPEILARARQALTDRVTLNWITGRKLKQWYRARAVLAGYDHV